MRVTRPQIGNSGLEQVRQSFAHRACCRGGMFFIGRGSHAVPRLFLDRS